MNHAGIIKDLGGPTALARLLGVADKAPLHWGARGIPPIHWHRIAKLSIAVEHGVTAEVLETTSPRAAVARQTASAPKPGEVAA